MDILYLRYTNSIFEPLWNRDHIQSVQVSMAEDFGWTTGEPSTTRSERCVTSSQNHLLQVIGLIASEPPSEADADSLRDKRLEVFRAMPPGRPEPLCPRAVRRVPVGARGEPRIANRDLRRAAARDRQLALVGCAILHPAGEELPVRATEVRIIFKPPPRLVFSPRTPRPDELVVRIDPAAGVDLIVQVKDPGPERSLRTIDLSLIFNDELPDPPEPYERLLGDVLRGDARLFVREDSEEQTWRIVQPLLDTPPPVQPYARGSWGPAGADQLLTGHPSWRRPWLPSPTSR